MTAVIAPAVQEAVSEDTTAEVRAELLLDVARQRLGVRLARPAQEGLEVVANDAVERRLRWPARCVGRREGRHGPRGCESRADHPPMRSRRLTRVSTWPGQIRKCPGMVRKPTKWQRTSRDVLPYSGTRLPKNIECSSCVVDHAARRPLDRGFIALTILACASLRSAAVNAPCSRSNSRTSSAPPFTLHLLGERIADVRALANPGARRLGGAR
jgi:hypothetical protein